MRSELAQAPLQPQDCVQPLPAQLKGVNTNTCIRVFCKRHKTGGSANSF